MSARYFSAIDHVSGSSVQFSSARGTNKGHADCNTSAVPDARRIASKYALLDTVASVAMTAIFGFTLSLVTSTAFRPPGPITPTTSTPTALRIGGSANAEAVL